MTKPSKGKTLDFGFEPERSPYHFAVKQPSMDHGMVRIEERFAFGQDMVESRAPVLKAVLDSYRWSRIGEAARSEFNRRLHADGLALGRWHASNETALSPYFGKELTLLAWAIEDADPTLIPNMLANWLGLAPEERWWLYTTINATSGHPEHGGDRGWRKAIKIAFGENPADAPPSFLLELGQEAVRLPLPADLSGVPPAPEHQVPDRDEHREQGNGSTPLKSRRPNRKSRAQILLLPED